MQSFNYRAYTYDGACYCTRCLPKNVDPNSEEVSPIFADSEWDSYPVCTVCGEVHDYVSLTEQGRRRYTERWESAEIRKMREESKTLDLPSFARHGGYPLVYLDNDHCAICPDCANQDRSKLSDDKAYVIATYFVHYEGPPELCENCGKEIESAYGNPNEDNDA